MNVEGFDNSSKLKSMRSVALSEAAGLLREIAGSRRADESVKGVFQRLSRDLVDWSYGRIRAVWYEDERLNIRAAEVEQLRQIAKRPKAQKDDAGTDELEELRSRVARLEQLLEANPPLRGAGPAIPREQRSALG
jgi:hypothetical protein